MRLPIDTTTIKFAASGDAELVLDFATKSQKTDEHGVPLFQVPVFSAVGGSDGWIRVQECAEDPLRRGDGRPLLHRQRSARRSFRRCRAKCRRRGWSRRHASCAN